MFQVWIFSVEGSIGFVVSIDHHLLLSHLFAECRQVAKAVLMDDETVEGIADRHTTGLGIVDDCLAHLQVTILVEVGVDDTGTRLNDGDAGGIADKVDEFPSTTGNTEVYISHGIEHLTRSLVGGRQQRDDIRADTVFLQDLMNQRHLLTIRAVGILTTFQHTGIAALETEGENVESHIGTGLIYHTNHTEGYRDPAEPQAVGKGLLLGDMSKGGGEGGDITHVGGDTFQTTACQLQTVVERILFRHLGQILGIRLQDSLLICYDCISDSL